MKIINLPKIDPNTARAMFIALEVLRQTGLLCQDKIDPGMLPDPSQWEPLREICDGNRHQYCIGISVKEAEGPELTVLIWVPPKREQPWTEIPTPGEPGRWALDILYPNVTLLAQYGVATSLIA